MWREKLSFVQYYRSTLKRGMQEWLAFLAEQQYVLNVKQALSQQTEMQRLSLAYHAFQYTAYLGALRDARYMGGGMGHACGGGARGSS